MPTVHCPLNTHRKFSLSFATIHRKSSPPGARPSYCLVFYKIILARKNVPELFAFCHYIILNIKPTTNQIYYKKRNPKCPALKLFWINASEFGILLHFRNQSYRLYVDVVKVVKVKKDGTGDLSMYLICITLVNRCYALFVQAAFLTAIYLGWVTLFVIPHTDSPTQFSDQKLFTLNFPSLIMRKPMQQDTRPCLFHAVFSTFHNCK